MNPQEIAALQYVLENFEPDWKTHDMSCWNVIRRMLEKAKGKRQNEQNAQKKHENTVFYWLNQIEDKEVKQKALSNLWPKYADALAYSTFQALGMAFCWSDSPEGADFWIQVRDKYGKEEEKQD